MAGCVSILAGFPFFFYPRVYVDHNVNNAKNRDVLTANRRVLATVSVDAEEKDRNERRVINAIGGFINFCLTFSFGIEQLATNKRGKKLENAVQ